MIQVHAKSLQFCLSPCNSVDRSQSGSSVHRILQARIMEWAAISSSQGIFLTWRLNLCLLCFLHWQIDSLPLVPPGKPGDTSRWVFFLKTKDT